MVGLRNVAEALAILGGAAVEGYGKGAMADILEKRQAVMDQLKAQREEAATQADRAFRSGEAEKERGFKRELVGEEREWEKEKIGMQEASEEKRLRLAASLRPKSSGGSGGGSKTAEERAIERIANINARKAGRETYNDDDWLAAYQEVNKKSSGSSERLPAQWELQKKVVSGRLGREATDAEVAAAFDKGEKSKEISIPEFQRMVTQNMDAVDPMKVERMGDPAAVRKKAEELTRREIEDMGGVAPGGTRAQPADEVSPQESVSEVEQPGVLDAPATDGKGGDTSQPTPKGRGTESSPYLATTEAELEWAVKNAGPGGWVIYNGQRYQVPEKE